MYAKIFIILNIKKRIIYSFLNYFNKFKLVR